MYQKAISYFITLLYRSFSDYSGEKLQQVGLNFGLLFFIVYIGKCPGCTPSELTKALSLDWGHSQRCITRLVEDGFITKEKSGRHYTLNLTQRGQQAFSTAHQVFSGWDDAFMAGLQPEEKSQLLALLNKAAEGVPHHVRNN
ncbi:MarR family transcriptional regulator [Gemmiger formicilis]|uniref:bilirubin utilization transcriptional regulator BilQ n=1 Tax=Gemmiger formicilis TaxID=745368 RepID=UPI00210D3853|nr:bilirubin utilization transcriptional regulator BilQ [Gemmiger formicilis]MCQ5080073.1 MarR family transcriptional regulator [Gemmiger formicilis]MCQ5116865.1 MarR family transcriptional regulator [Gemmiger formicilis]